MRCVRVVAFLLFLQGAQSWWPFSSQPRSESSAVEETKRPITFEINSVEQKFLAEAQHFLDLPQLDQCQHGVISRLRGSCGSLHEEELGKLAVELLNCQSLTEGRATFPCTQAMTLAECTGTMDASTWNAYHIISNRARSVCLATRQEHFKRQTEVAVNQLSVSTLQQLSAVRELAVSHQEIKALTQDSLQNVQREQSELAEKQEVLAARQDMVRGKITDNLAQLARERTLIHSGQKQLVNMTDGIKQQLEQASSLLSNQEKSRRQGQSEIVEDLTRVRENIQEVWRRVDSSTGQLLVLMEEMNSKYESTLNNLDRINSSVNSVMSLVVAMETTISSQLDWLVGQLGGAQDGLRILILLSTHFAYLLMATLCVLFVKAPAFARVVLLTLVCGNVFLEVQYRVSLTFSALAALQALVIAGNWVYLWWLTSSKSRAPQPMIVANDPIRSLPSSPWEPSPWEPELDDYRRSSTPIPFDDDRNIETLTHTPTKTLVMSTPTKHMDNVQVHKCTARTKTGSKCRLSATPGGSKCRRHL